MPVEIFGLVNHNIGGLSRPQPGADFDVAAVEAFARVHDQGQFDRVLIANTATMPDSFALGAHVASLTHRLGLMLAHRPGFMPPTMAARMLATIDRLSGGRAAVHIIAGADDREVQADGDFLSKDARYRRAGEYVEVMRKVWASAQPFDHDGEHYRFRGAHALVRPEAGAIPVFCGGVSDLAIDLAGRWGDTYAMFGDTLAGAAELASQVRSAAERHGRSIELLMTFLVVGGGTENQAWDRATDILSRVKANVAKAASPRIPASNLKLASLGMQRLLDRTQEGERLDSCLWTGVNKAMQGRGNNTALVGSPDQIVTSLMAYYRLGVRKFLLRGFDPLEDARGIAQDVIPLLRRCVAQWDAEAKTENRVGSSVQTAN